MAVPTLRYERSLMRSGVRTLVAMDEVGRGALSGPVSVGVVAVTIATRSAPVGVRDSKLLTPEVRERLVPQIKRWAHGWAVGHASAAEIDQTGIMGALRLAGCRAVEQLDVGADLVLLDGNYDWLSGPDELPTLFDVGQSESEIPIPPVVTRIKADVSCAAVAAASVLAKVERDAIMTDLAADFAAYGWQHNKGYASAEHRMALESCGPSPHHRRSWKLPGIEQWEASA